jgi:transposase
MSFAVRAASWGSGVVVAGVWVLEGLLNALLATVRPRDPAGSTRRRMAAEELADIGRLDAKLKAMKAELKAAVAASESHLMDIHGIGPAGAARILADVGDVARFPNRAHFASWTGTAPIDASSGQHTHHRLSRAGNRRINHVLYMASIVQLRHDTAGRTYYRRRIAEGKTPMEAMRCLRRRLSDVVYRQLVADTRPPQQTGPGGHPGATLSSSAAGLPPDTGTSDQPLPGPAPATLPPPPATPKTPAAPAGAPAATARPRCQPGAPHRTNDVDTGQRRRIIKTPGAGLLTSTPHRREP